VGLRADQARVAAVVGEGVKGSVRFSPDAETPASAKRPLPRWPAFRHAASCCRHSDRDVLRDCSVGLAELGRELRRREDREVVAQDEQVLVAGDQVSASVNR
jgi:hypothetical protein